MAQQDRGVVAHGEEQPVRVEAIVVPDPGPGEAVVAIQACGVCHTDLHDGEGGINDEFPFLLGHEAAGVGEVVGEGVTDVAAGDSVRLNWRAVCGSCRACARGEAQYCFDTCNAAIAGAKVAGATTIIIAVDIDPRKLDSETITLDDIEAAFDKMHRGEVLRSVVLL